jgi:hypothetical protein
MIFSNKIDFFASLKKKKVTLWGLEVTFLDKNFQKRTIIFCYCKLINHQCQKRILETVLKHYVNVQ